MTIDRRALLLTLLLPLGSALWPVQAMAKGGEGSGGDDDDDDDDDDGGGGSGGSGGDDDDDDDDDDDGGGGGNGGGSGDDDDDDDDDDDSSGSGGGGSGSSGSGNGSGLGGRSGSGEGSTSPRDRLPALKPGQYRISRKGRIEALSQSQFRSLMQGGTGQNWSQLVQITPGRVTVTDSAGWREEFRAERYRLFDPRGNLVTRRALTRKDTARLRSLLGL